ncbi:MAG: recombinase family protein [Patescibacteria group bacterium]
MMKYIAYCRKSREEKDKQILSIEAQIAELKEFAKRENLEIVEFVEEAKTAKVPGRENFDKVIKKIEKGEASGIIAWHPDRLARNSIDGGKIIYLLDTKKILDLKFPSFWFENTPQGKFMLSIAFGQSKYYVDNLSENVKRGLRQKLRNGVWPSRAPYGYINNAITRGIEVDDKKAKAIIKAYEIFSDGSKTFTDISTFLFKFDFQTKNGKPLNVNQVRQILSNKFYGGIMKYNGEFHEGKHKIFISKQLFQKVQAELAKRDKHYKKSNGFPFLGIFKCKECGVAITAEKHAKFYKGTNRTATYFYYRCTKKLGACSQKAITAFEMENQIKEMLEKVSLPKLWVKNWLNWLEKDELLEQDSQSKTIEKLQIELEAINKKQNFLLDSFLDQVIDNDTYKNKKNELFETKIKLEEDLGKIKDNGSSRLEPFREFINVASQCGKIAGAKNTNEELAFFVKTVGSNFYLDNRRLAVSFKQGFDVVQTESQRLGGFSNVSPNSWSVGMP